MKLLYRKIVRSILIVSIAMCSLFGISIANADNHPEQVKSCVACHGEKGVSNNPQWPNLAGQNDAYLAQQLKAYRDGSRQNELMTGLVSGLSDEDIAIIAQYYSQQPLSISANGDESLVEMGHQRAAYCVSCHGMWGKPANPEWPILAGQQAEYLYTQLVAFKSGERVSPVMQPVLQHLNEKDFAALAAYYSQLKVD